MPRVCAPIICVTRAHFFFLPQGFQKITWGQLALSLMLSAQHGDRLQASRQKIGEGSRLLLCVARLAAVSCHLLRRVAGWPLAHTTVPTYQGARCLPPRATLPSPPPLYGGACAGAGKKWPQGLLQTRTGATTTTTILCVSAEGFAAARIRAMLCYTGRAGEQSEQVSRYWPILSQTRLEHLSTWRDAVGARRCVNSPSSATPALLAVQCAGLIGGLFCLACGVSDSLPARPVQSFFSDGQALRIQ